MTLHYPRKRFSQNFLQDQYVIDQIINYFNPEPGQSIIEIGPGLGALTDPILKQTGKLHAIEIDRDLVKKLTDQFTGKGELIIHNIDILKVSLSEFGKHIRIIGNLPYNISTPVLFYLLDQIDAIQDIFLMLQEEVVDRICASTGNKIYGRLSVMVQSQCHVEKLFTVDAKAFYPIPKVNSAIVRLVPDNKSYTIPDQNIFSSIVKQAFSQRRKTIRNSINVFLSEKNIQSLNIDPLLRAEDLSINDYIKLTQKVINLNN